MTKVQILSRWNASVLFECEVADDKPLKMRFAVSLAVKTRANLSGANLSRANLSGADLSGARIIDGGLRSDGWRFLLTCLGDEGWRIKASCRNFSPAEAREHWQRTRGGTQLGDETFAILDHMERLAKIRGWDIYEAVPAIEAEKAAT